MDGRRSWKGSRRDDKSHDLSWRALERHRAERDKGRGVSDPPGDNDAAAAGWKGKVEESDECLKGGQLIKQPRNQSGGLIKAAASRPQSRYFKLYWDELQYFSMDKHGTLDKKGFLPTQNICAVEELTDARFDKYSFQVFTSTIKDKKPISLNLTAANDEDRQDWMAEVRLLCYMRGNIMYAHYHPDVFGSKEWPCCKNLLHIKGCKLAYQYPTKSFEELIQEEEELQDAAAPEPSPAPEMSPRPDSRPESDIFLSVPGPKDERKGRSASLVNLDSATGGLDENKAGDSDSAEGQAKQKRGENPFIATIRRRYSTAGRPPAKPGQQSDKKAPPKPSRKNPFARFASNENGNDTSPPVSPDNTSTPKNTTSKVSESSERSQNENGVPLIDFETPKPATILDTATDDTAVDSTDGGSLPADGQSSWVAEWPDMVNVGNGSTVNDTVVEAEQAPPSTTDVATDSKESQLAENGSNIEGSEGKTTSEINEGKKEEERENATKEVATQEESESNPFGDTGQFSSWPATDVDAVVNSPSKQSQTPPSSPPDVTICFPQPPGSTGAPRPRRLSTADLSSTITSDDSSTKDSGSGLLTPVVTRPGKSGSVIGPGSRPQSMSIQGASAQLSNVQPVVDPGRPMDAEDEESANSQLISSSEGKQQDMPSVVPRDKPSGSRASKMSQSDPFDIVSVNDFKDSPCEEQPPASSQFKELHQACQHGLVDEVIKQLDAGINPDEPHEDNRQPPIFLAYNHDHIEVLDVLLSRGAHVNMTMGGLTLLHISASKNNLAIMELLLKKGARVDFKDWELKTPLHLACEAGHVEAARLLLEHEADMTLADQQKFTCLHMSSQGGHVGVVKLLLEHEAPAFTKNKQDLTPLDLAVKEGHSEVTEILRTLLPDTHQAYVSKQVFRAHRKEVNTVALLPDGMILSGASDNQTCIWDSSNTEKAVLRRKLTNTILSSAVHLTESQSLIAIGSDKVIVLDLKRAGWRAVILDDMESPRDEQLYLVSFSPTGLLATSGVVSKTTVLLWDLFEEQSGLVRRPVREINVDQEGPAVVHSVQFSSREERPLMAVSVQPGKDRLHPKGNNCIHLFDWTTGCHLRCIDTGHEEVTCDVSMTFSAHGRYIIAGSGSGKVSIWAAASGLLINQIEAQTGTPVTNVSFSGNGHTLAIGSDSGKVDLYNIVTGRPFFLPEQKQQRPVLSLAFSKYGDALVAGYDDGTVQLWNVVGGAVQAAAVEVEALSPFDYIKAIQPNGEMSTASREFLHQEYKKLDKDNEESLGEAQLNDYFISFLNTDLTDDMFVELQENFLTDADLGGLTVEGFASMAFTHFCLDPETMWPIWLEMGFPSTI